MIDSLCQDLHDDSFFFGLGFELNSSPSFTSSYIYLEAGKAQV